MLIYIFGMITFSINWGGGALNYKGRGSMMGPGRIIWDFTPPNNKKEKDIDIRYPIK